MKKTTMFLSTVALIGSVVFTSCKDDAPAAPSSLYTQVGGTAMVSDPANSGKQIEKGYLTLRSVVDSAIFVIAGDPTQEKFFGKLLAEVDAKDLSGFSALSKNFTDFLAVATGSTNIKYTGKSMLAAHDPATNSRMGVKATDADFDRFIADIDKALAQNGVTAQTAAQLRLDLVALLNTTKGDVVQTTLYAQVGGTTMVADPNSTSGGKIEAGYLTLRSVVDSAIFVIAADPTQTKFFGKLLGEVGAGNLTGFSALSKNFTDFLAVATGSKTVTYSGKSMKAAHDPATNSRMGEKAANVDFDNFIVDIDKALAQNGVTPVTAAQLRLDLVALLNTTKTDIVQK